MADVLQTHLGAPPSTSRSADRVGAGARALHRALTPPGRHRAIEVEALQTTRRGHPYVGRPPAVSTRIQDVTELLSRAGGYKAGSTRPSAGGPALRPRLRGPGTSGAASTPRRAAGAAVHPLPRRRVGDADRRPAVRSGSAGRAGRAAVGIGDGRGALLDLRLRLRMDVANHAALADRPQAEVAAQFTAAFAAAWRGEAETEGSERGPAHRPVVAGGRGAAGLRPLLRQLGNPTRELHGRHAPRASAVARALLGLFTPRASTGARHGRPHRRRGPALARVRELIDAVTGLDADRILRAASP